MGKKQFLTMFLVAFIGIVPVYANDFDVYSSKDKSFKIGVISEAYTALSPGWNIIQLEGFIWRKSINLSKDGSSFKVIVKKEFVRETPNGKKLYILPDGFIAKNTQNHINKKWVHISFNAWIYSPTLEKTVEKVSSDEVDDVYKQENKVSDDIEQVKHHEQKITATSTQQSHPSTTIFIIFALVLIVIASLLAISIKFSLYYRDKFKEIAHELNLKKQELKRFDGIINIEHELQTLDKVKKEKLSEIEYINVALRIESEINALYRIKKEKREEIDKIKSEIERIKRQRSLDAIHAEEEKNEIDKEIRTLKKELKFLRENLEYAEVLIYDRQYVDVNSAQIKSKLNDVIKEQKSLIRNKEGLIYSGGISFDNSQKKGTVFANKLIKLALRAFNGECNVLISKISAKNIQLTIERIVKISEDIIKSVGEYHISMNHEYLQLKIREARLMHEYRLNQKIEADIEREERERIKEEKKAEKEQENALKEVEEQERRDQIALERAQEALMSSTAEMRARLMIKIKELELQLSQSDEKKRAISQAQLTKNGHIYIISNIGSFGEYVYKIGMTRRLNPNDRIKELSSASVPFTFDIHAIFRVDNAPEIEKKIHADLDRYRVNRVNNRKEFFRVDLDTIERTVLKYCDEVAICPSAEAVEYWASKTE